MVTFPITSLDYSLLFLALFLGLWGCAWSISVARKRKKERGDISPIVTVSDRIKQKAHTALANTAKVGLGIILGVLLGMGIRDRQLLSNTRMYFGVSVLSQQSDRRYSVQIPGYVKAYDWEFCDPLKMPGPLIDIKYEQRFGCKAVNGVGFVQIHEERNNAELQTGRNSTTAPTPAYARLEGRR